MCSSLAKPWCAAKKDSDSSLSSLLPTNLMVFPKATGLQDVEACSWHSLLSLFRFRAMQCIFDLTVSVWVFAGPYPDLSPFRAVPLPLSGTPRSILPSLKAFLITSSWHFLLPLCRSCFLALNSTRRVRSGSLTLPGSWGFALIHHVIWRFPRGKGLEWFPHHCQRRFLFLSSQTYLSSQQNPSSPQIQWRHCLFSSVWGAGASPSSPVGLFFLQLLWDCILGRTALVTR